MTLSPDQNLELIEKCLDWDEKAKATLSNLALDEDAEVRMRAIEKISEIAVELPTDVMQTALKDEDEIVRLTAIEAIDDRSLVEFRELLVGMLDDKEYLVRSAIARYLGHIGSESDVDSLVKLLGAADHDTVKASVYFAMCKIRPQDYRIWLSKIETLLKLSNYLTKCCIANEFASGSMSDHKAEVITIIAEALKNEKDAATVSSLNHAAAMMGINEDASL